MESREVGCNEINEEIVIVCLMVLRKGENINKNDFSSVRMPWKKMKKGGKNYWRKQKGIAKAFRHHFPYKRWGSWGESAFLKDLVFLPQLFRTTKQKNYVCKSVCIHPVNSSFVQRQLFETFLTNFIKKPKQENSRFHFLFLFSFLSTFMIIMKMKALKLMGRN